MVCHTLRTCGEIGELFICRSLGILWRVNEDNRVGCDGARGYRKRYTDPGLTAKDVGR